jgi:hypothetical protein
MKKLILITGILFIAFSCKKIDKEPIGPTDVRVRNITTVIMTNLTVNTYDSTFNFGILKADSVSAYHRFSRAYSKANITAIINGLKYKTDTVTYGWMNYMGKMKITYEIYIENDALKKLKISNVIPESGLK